MSERNNSASGCGCLSIVPGQILAAVVSYAAWGSILWAIVHGIFGWFYIAYFILVYGMAV
jgi:hypothetical protein